MGDDPSHEPVSGGGFQQRVAKKITGSQTMHLLGRRWDYPPLDTVIQESGFEEMAEYEMKRKNMVAKYIVTQPIMDLCEEIVQMSGTCVKRRWW